jgi:hypothetical protein
MAIEKDRGCMDGLLLAPVDRSAIYFGKVISNLAFMLIVEIIVLPVYSVLYNINLFKPGLLLVILLGSIGYVGVGTLLSAMAVQTRTRDILLPILLFPVVIPVLLSAVKASSGILEGLEFSEFLLPINLLITYDIIFIAVAFMVFDSVVKNKLLPNLSSKQKRNLPRSIHARQTNHLKPRYYPSSYWAFHYSFCFAPTELVAGDAACVLFHIGTAWTALLGFLLAAVFSVIFISKDLNGTATRSR